MSAVNCKGSTGMDYNIYLIHEFYMFAVQVLAVPRRDRSCRLTSRRLVRFGQGYGRIPGRPYSSLFVQQATICLL